MQAIVPELLREQGLLEYENGHYAAAAIHFQSAAESGDARSAEVLALMYRFGARLYGDQLNADAAKTAYRAALPAMGAGEPVCEMPHSR